MTSMLAAAVACCLAVVVISGVKAGDEIKVIDATLQPGAYSNKTKTLTPCTCAVFLSGQFVKGSKAQPKGLPALTHEYDTPSPCNSIGNRQCINKCLESLVKHLPNSPAIICATSGRDCHKERAYLFYKNCADSWINSNLAAGREYCCKDGLSYQCPLLS